MNIALLLYVIYLSSILSCAIVAYALRKSLPGRKLFIFVPYLFYVFTQELSLWIAQSYNSAASTNLVYNIYRFLTVFLFGYVYYSIPLMAPLRKIILWMAILYLLAFIVIHGFFDSILNSNGYLVLMRGIVISFFGIFFLFRYFHLDNRSEEEFWMPVLWVTVGIIIFYPVTGISTGFQKYLSDNNATFAGFKLYQLIPQVLSIFMYGCFTYAFYLCKKKS